MVDPKKIEAVVNWEAPKNVYEVRSSLDQPVIIEDLFKISQLLLLL